MVFFKCWCLFDVLATVFIAWVKDLAIVQWPEAYKSRQMEPENKQRAVI